MSRTRTSAISRPAGGKRYAEFNGTVIADSVQPAASPWVQHTCVDTSGYGPDHNLNITHIDLSGVQPLTGEIIGVNRVDRWENNYPTGSSSVPGFGLTPPGFASVAEVATATISRSNPTRPYVSVPNFLFELKDLPGMIRDIGRLKLYGKGESGGPIGHAPSAKDAANHYLSGVMGWAPLISDLRKLTNFQEKVNNRVTDLDNLFNGNGGLHRSVGKANPKTGKPGSWVFQTNKVSSVFIDTLGPSLTVKAEESILWERWGTVRWMSTALPSYHLSRKQMDQKARNLVLGLNVNPKAIWDAVPWSWMIDWYANMGEYLGTYHNALPCAPSVVCVMTHKKAEIAWTRSDQYVLQVHGGYGSRITETKDRSVVSGPSLTATIPFLSGRHFSILGALALQRFSR